MDKNVKCDICEKNEYESSCYVNNGIIYCRVCKSNLSKCFKCGEEFDSDELIKNDGMMVCYECNKIINNEL